MRSLTLTSPVKLAGEDNCDSILKPNKRIKIGRLERENAALKEALGVHGHMNLEGWGEYATPKLRDQMAAAALVAAGLHPFYALRRLGFSPVEGETTVWRPIADAVFKTPGVKEILDADGEKFEEDKELVLKRLSQIVKFEEPRLATQAASVMAKMIPGWGDGDKGKSSAYIQNFLVSIGEAVGGSARVVNNGELAQPAIQDEIIDAEEFLAIDTGEVAVVEDSPEATR